MSDSNPPNHEDGSREAARGAQQRGRGTAAGEVGRMKARVGTAAGGEGWGGAFFNFQINFITCK